MSEPQRYNLEPFATDALVPDEEGDFVLWADVVARLSHDRGADAAWSEPLYFEPCRDFTAPASCYTNDGTGLWCEPCLVRRATHDRGADAWYQQAKRGTEQWVELFEAHNRGDDLGPIFERHVSEASDAIEAVLSVPAAPTEEERQHERD